MGCIRLILHICMVSCALVERDPYDDMGPDSTGELIDLGPVSVPFTSEQLTAVSKIVREQGTSHGEVIRELLAEALAAREPRR